MLHFLGQTHSSSFRKHFVKGETVSSSSYTHAVGMVGIHHELEVGPDGLPGGLDPLQILGHGEEPHLHLDSPEAGLLEGPGLLGARPDTLPDVDGARILMVMSRRGS